jgi:transglutaminase-like putative cysteine protease
MRAAAEAALVGLERALPGDTTLLRERASRERERGDVAGALADLDRLAQARPESAPLLLDRAALLATVRPEQAESALRALCAQLPDEPRVWEQLGRLLIRLGKSDDAAPALTRALALRPQSPEVRLLLARLAPAQGGELADQFARDPRPIAAAARARAFPGESAVVLSDLKATRVHENGLSQAYVQRLLLIVDQRGAREQADQEVRYTPDTQSVEVRAARVLKPSGEIVQAQAREDRDLSEPWYGLYYDVRGLLIRFERLEPGDVIEVGYVVSEVGGHNLLGGYFGDLYYVQDELLRLESRYVLLAPAARPIFANDPRLRGVAHSETQVGAERRYEWQAREVPKVELEAGMPGFSEVAAYLHVSTYRTWAEVATFYRGLVRDQIVVDPVIREAARRATADATDERAKVTALYDFVVRSTRYVGLEFGIHGYQPFRTTQVLARKFGDCKDKAGLLVALLQAVGVQAHVVIVRTRRGGDVDPVPASLAIFDHAIVYVPKYDLWLDGTAEYAGATELPAQDQGVLVLPLDPGRAALVRTPVVAAEHNRVARRERIALAADGGARVAEEVTLRGQAAPEWREHYQAAGERRERYEKAWNTRQPGAHVVAVEMPGIEERERPVVVHAEVELARLGRRLGAGSALPATARESELARSYARLSTRKHDLVLAYPWRQDEEFTFMLPPGWRVTKLPEARSAETAFGRFALALAEADGRVVVRAQLEVSRHRVAQQDYPAFRQFLIDADAAMNQEIVVTP